MNAAKVISLDAAREVRTRDTEKAAAIVAHPELIVVEKGMCSRVTAAKNIRKQLKAAFPGVKFSVRGETFSMGDAIRVSWVDGPTTKQVDAITKEYESGTFDAMTDCSGYRHSGWMDAFGDAKYVTTSREYSPKLSTAVAEHVAGIYCAPVPEIKIWNHDGSAHIQCGERIEHCKLGHYRCENVGECANHVLHKISR